MLVNVFFPRSLCILHGTDGFLLYTKAREANDVTPWRTQRSIFSYKKKNAKWQMQTRRFTSNSIKSQSFIADLGTSFIISFADTWFVLVVRARLFFYNIFWRFSFHFSYRIYFYMFFLGGSAWPRPVTDHPSKSSSTCSHSFHMAEKQSLK